MFFRRLLYFLFLVVLLVLCIPLGVLYSQENELEKANVLSEKVVWLYKQGRYAEALSIAQQILEIRGKVLGPEHPDSATSLNNLALLYYSLGDYSKGEPLYKRALAIREKVLGPEHPDTALSLNNLASLYNDLGDYSKAEPLLKRVLAVREKVLGPEHPDTAKILNSLACLYNNLGNYSKAEPLLKRAIAVREKVLGPEHPDTATTLNNLALLYTSLGDYSKAEPLFIRAITIREKALGPEHPDTARSISSLASFYKTVGDYNKAEPLYKRVIAIQEKVLGPEHPDTATNLNNLAGFYYSLGDYSKAESLYKRALAIREKTLGPEHYHTAISINSLALLYNSIGDYNKSESLYKRALTVTEEALGPEHPNTAVILNNLAEFYRTLGDYSNAEPLLKRALAICEKVLGPEHPNTAISLNNLASLYSSLGDYKKAEPLLKRALAITEKVLGHEHPNTALSLNNLAWVYQTHSDYSKAEPLYKRSLAITEKVLGPEHPSTALNLNNLALIYAAREDFLKAHEFHIRAQIIDNKLIDQIMGFTSEEQKIQFLSTRKADLEGTMSLAAFHLSNDPQVITNVLNVWLRRKGVILEAQRRYQDALVYSDDPEAAQVFQSLSRVRSQLSRLVFGQSEKISPENLSLKIAELEKEKDDLEARLSRLSLAFAKQKTVERADARTVAAALPQNTALLEFAKIPKINFKATGKEPMWGPEHYLAFVVHAGKGNKVRLVNIGEAGIIDEAIADFKRAMSDTEVGSKESQREEINTYTRKLYSLVFEPIKKELGPVREVFISPDGNLNLIPFEALQDPQGRYLIEDYTFNYLAAGRDLAGFGKIKEKSGRCLLMGDPDFDMSGEEKESALTRLGLNRQNENQTLMTKRSGEMRGMRFAPLPGTRKEIEAIAGILGSEKAETFTGKQALSEVLATRHSPRILHIATHGFFLADQEITAFADSKGRGITTVKPLPVGKYDNPLRRSGLALAGANLSLQIENPDASDGLLTAEKVLGLRLGGTELVVLSACQTGLGDVKAGEGVYGLRRAITQAGAKGLVMSMWSVPDRETQELMTSFYRNLESGKYNRVQALRVAALEQMETIRKRYGNTDPFYWGAFVYMGEP